MEGRYINLYISRLQGQALLKAIEEEFNHQEACDTKRSIGGRKAFFLLQQRLRSELEARNGD